MPNHLQTEISPYLLQHANNPVDWFPWGPEALQKAHIENKPIFLSIGYAACHWCHVMEHESFENLRTAAILNQFFVSIKVDREERPDLDMIYMLAVQNLTGQGGWPLNVFLTPDLKPFYGGTYFPPVPKYGMPAFPDLLAALADSWRKEPEKIASISGQLADQIASEAYWKGQDGPAVLTPGSLESAAAKLLSTYDWDNGGWGSAPKFPAPMAIEFLLSQASRGNSESLRAAVHALDAMSRGGLFDVVGGGFHRYSTDESWLVPHFEKMLYDNAQLAQVYLHAYKVTGEPRFRDITERTLDFILRELTDAQGGFYSSLDADSEGEEGKFYLWTGEELVRVLGEADFNRLGHVYDISTGGNFEGKIILQRKFNSPEALIHSGPDHQQLSTLQQALFARRAERVRPATDTKVLTGWNGLALKVLSEAGISLKRQDYLAAAQRNASFILTSLFSGGSLGRSWRNGVRKHNAILEDYASLILGLLALYQADFNLHWYQKAEELTCQMIELFRDSTGGFYLTRSDQTDLVTRPKDLQDNATPSANALAMHALLSMAAFSGSSEWSTLAEVTLQQLQETIVRYPGSFPYWLQALDFAVGPVNQVALAANDLADTAQVSAHFFRQYHPRSILAASGLHVGANSPEILQNRPPLDGKLTAYICHGFVCDLPLTDEMKIKNAFDSLT